jgi:hypothetical protein
MLAVARTNGATDMMCAALNRLALVVAQQSYDLTAAEGLLREAQQLATETDDQPALAETEVNLAQIGFYGWDGPSAYIHGQHALTLARQSSVEELVARSLNVLAYAAIFVGAVGKLLHMRWKLERCMLVWATERWKPIVCAHLPTPTYGLVRLNRDYKQRRKHMRSVRRLIMLGDR